MKIISKEKAHLGYGIDGKLYCFEERNYNYADSSYDYFKFLSDITVNDDNEVHSFNDQPALIFKNNFNKLCKSWFINGKRKRLNEEKPCCIVKGLCYVFNNGKTIGIENLKENLR